MLPTQDGPGCVREIQKPFEQKYHEPAPFIQLASLKTQSRSSLLWRWTCKQEGLPRMAGIFSAKKSLESHSWWDSREGSTGETTMRPSKPVASGDACMDATWPGSSLFTEKVSIQISRRGCGRWGSPVG